MSNSVTISIQKTKLQELINDTRSRVFEFRKIADEAFKRSKIKEYNENQNNQKTFFFFKKKPEYINSFEEYEEFFNKDIEDKNFGDLASSIDAVLGRIKFNMAYPCRTYEDILHICSLYENAIKYVYSDYVDVSIVDLEKLTYPI